MNKVLVILVEGQTELEFVREVICPYFESQGIKNVIRPISIETSPGFKGGDVRYVERYKKNINKILSGKENLLVTSLIDYYRLRSDFPNYAESRTIRDINARIDLIEKGCFEDINDERFLPYIQLHEFEGLLFSAANGFELFPDLSNSSRKELREIVEKFPNPELINDRAEFAPSKRILKLIPNYEKPFHGPMIALENGFDVIIQKCPRFRNWIETLIKRMQE